MIAAIPLPVWITVVPAVLLLVVTVAFQPNSVNRPKHREGVRASRIVRREEAARERLQRRRPTGFVSPAWTVQPREVVTR